jgi:murein DD-endopeptidase MepM/ murein hydrolase activator NlpD
MRLNLRGISRAVAASGLGALALAGCIVPTAARTATTTTTYPPGAVFPILCPVPSPVYFVEDWHAPRSGGTLHEGNDLLATRATPAVAVVSGVIRQKIGAIQGNAVWLDGDDGNQYFYAHFDSYVGVPRRVAAGETIGLVGNTGDAAGGPTHVHFEIHPNHGDAVDAYPSDAAHCTRLTSPPPAS